MPGRPSDRVGEIVVGPFEVAADPETVAAFAAAVDATGPEPPATFPATWLSLPRVKEALAAAIGPGHLPVHESQSFDYERPLRSGARYLLSATAWREEGPARLVFVAEAAEPDGRIAVAMRSVLRIVRIGEDKIR